MTKAKAKDDTTLELPDEQTITGVRDECQDGKRYGHVHNNALLKKINGEGNGVMSLKDRFGSE